MTVGNGSNQQFRNSIRMAKDKDEQEIVVRMESCSKFSGAVMKPTGNREYFCEFSIHMKLTKDEVEKINTNPTIENLLELINNTKP
jgi:hypothetical protein